MFSRLIRHGLIIFRYKKHENLHNQNFTAALAKRHFVSVLDLPKNVSNEEGENDENQKNVDKNKMLKILRLEIDILRQEGRRVPDPEFFKESNWDHLLSLRSRSARFKYYSYLWQLEKKKENELVRKQIKSKKILERKKIIEEENAKNDHIIYGISHNTFFLRMYDTTINHWHNNKLINAMKFGPKIVLDCGYDSNLNSREAMNTAKQLMLLFADNRFHDEPFDLHYCNANLSDITMKTLQRNIPTMLEPSFPLNIHEKCFTEVFPKEKLVYLTPHCRNDLNSYNEDDVYIIGAIVDKVNNEPLSLAKAKKMGLRMARLPLDKYLSWGSGSGKSLTLDQMIRILLDVKSTGDWNYALRHVPRRKLNNDYEQKKSREKLKFRAKKFEFNIDTWGDSKSKNKENDQFKKNPFK